MSEPLIPAYGSDSLADLLPSIGAQMGMRGTNRLGLPQAQRYLVLLIDGLGAAQLAAHAELAPFLAGLPQQVISSGVPSTTATSITSLGTGLVPGAHGIAGYSFWHEPTKAVLNALRWSQDVSGLDVQPQLTYFERLADAGITVSAIAPAAFAKTGLTTVALRGASFWPVDDESDLDRRAELAASAATAGERSVTYCYERRLDHTGHGAGVNSDAWRASLAAVDRLASTLRARVPGDVRLVITADHGMVDVPADTRLIVEDEPELLRGVDALAGEGRLRHLKVAASAVDEVAERWRQRLGERAWVRTRVEAEAEDWFGLMSPRLSDRFGDVIVAMADDSAILTRRHAGELGLIGMHGSLTPAEVQIPLLMA